VRQPRRHHPRARPGCLRVRNQSPTSAFVGGHHDLPAGGQWKCPQAATPPPYVVAVLVLLVRGIRLDSGYGRGSLAAGPADRWRERLDRVLVLRRRHLEAVLSDFAEHYKAHGRSGPSTSSRRLAALRRSSPCQWPRSLQATKGPSPGWAPPRAPDGRLTWRDDFFTPFAPHRLPLPDHRPRVRCSGSQTPA